MELASYQLFMRSCPVKTDWTGIDKLQVISYFYSTGCGLPIGNLTLFQPLFIGPMTSVIGGFRGF